MTRISLALAQTLADGRIDPEDLPTQKRSKYGNEQTEVEGIRFDSKAEAERYGELRLLERAGLISDLWLQPQYTLLEAFRDRGGKRQREIKYFADFRYRENGRIVVEDVKGVETKEFRIKAKLFRKQYPDVEFRIIRR